MGVATAIKQAVSAAESIDGNAVVDDNAVDGDVVVAVIADAALTLLMLCVLALLVLC